MKGWKTWLGAAIVALSAALVALGKAYPEIQWAEPVGQGLMVVGGALGIVGVGHKVEKAGQARIVSEVGTTISSPTFPMGASQPVNSSGTEVVSRE